MSTPDFKPGVAEFSESLGPPYVLGGSFADTASFRSAVDDGTEVSYSVSDRAKTEWRRGVFDRVNNRLTAGQLKRSTTGGAISWGAGRRIVTLEIGDDISDFAPVQSVAGQTGNIITIGPEYGGTGADLSATGGPRESVFQEEPGGPLLVRPIISGDVADFIESSFWSTVQTAAATSLGDLDDLVLLANVSCGDLVGCGESSTDEFTNVTLGELSPPALVSALSDFIESTFWATVQTAAATSIGDLADIVILGNFACGDLEEAGNTPAADFINVTLGEIF